MVNIMVTNGNAKPICPICNKEMDISLNTVGSGMDGCYEDYILKCPTCGIYKRYPADGFYGRDYYKSKEEVIAEWDNMIRRKKVNKRDKDHQLYLQELERLQKLTSELDAYDLNDFPDTDWKSLARDVRSANDRIDLLLNSMVEE